MHMLLRTIWFAIVLIFASPVSAQEEADLSDDERALALAVAQVCANESSLDDPRPADCALIWQATRRHGATAAERLSWLRHHSSCVLTERELTRRELVAGNCRWTRNLTDTDDQPEGWPAHWVWENHSGRWAAMRRYCLQLVAGRVPRGGFPCSEDPDTWGGVMDHARARSLGWRALSCRGTSNDGYRYR